MELVKHCHSLLCSIIYYAVEKEFQPFWVYLRVTVKLDILHFVLTGYSELGISAQFVWKSTETTNLTCLWCAVTCVIAGSTQVWISYLYAAFLMTLAREDLLFTSSFHITCERLFFVASSIEVGHCMGRRLITEQKIQHWPGTNAISVSSVSLKRDVFTLYSLMVGRFTKKMYLRIEPLFPFVRCVYQA